MRKRFLLLTRGEGIGKTTLVSLICLYLATNGGSEGCPDLRFPQKIEEILQTLLQGLGAFANGE
jgi:hypothetical protein